MRSGLEVLLDDPSSLRGARVGLCCNPTAVDRSYRHAIELLSGAGVVLTRLFGPEHGVAATAQDMIGVAGADGPDGCVSLYGDSEDSLRPPPETLDDLDVLVFDIQDIGSRYYTYQATLGFVMEVAAGTGTRVVVLDRPNPIDGVSVEGNVVAPGFESFVSAYPLATRHGMTMGELGRYFQRVVGIDCALEVIRCEGWHRDTYSDEGDLPWVLPSPNMPTLETAILYPGMCLIEGTNLSEGRGTTRPFNLVGAPWLDSGQFATMCRKGALDAGLEGVAFRAADFLPQFQKHAGVVCGGVEVHLDNRHALHAVLLGWVVIEAARRCDPDNFAWRTETYEFVDEPIAIDLLCGSTEGRAAIETTIPVRDLVEHWDRSREAWDEARNSVLLY
ncbi:MAG TPA: DUF1343 domain-containing protein [Myxococcota bacterium]|nr:DUF1343 domain-containing protein [Myxococcota bacterium]